MVNNLYEGSLVYFDLLETAGYTSSAIAEFHLPVSKKFGVFRFAGLINDYNNPNNNSDDEDGNGDDDDTTNTMLSIAVLAFKVRRLIAATSTFSLLNKPRKDEMKGLLFYLYLFLWLSILLLIVYI